jgi:amino acid adenylation domain-containing protein
MNPPGVSDTLPALPLERSELDRPIGDRLLRVVRQYPDLPALRAGERCLTYREMERELRRVAAAVIQRTQPGVGCVATLADHSVEMILGPLGAILAGKASLGIHPGLPAAAQRAILEDARPEVLLTTAAHAERAMEIAEGTGCPVVRLDSLEAAPEPLAIPREVSAGDPATLLYTSGSTGRPKGVVRSHRAVLHRIALAGSLDGIRPGDRLSLLTSVSFAAAEVDVFGPLLFGATVCLFDVAHHGLAPMVEWIHAERITHLHPPALLFRRCLRTLEPGVRFPSVRVVAIAGDVVLPADVALWRQHFPPACVLMHRFSSTETALIAVERIEHSDAVPEAVVSVGRPVPDKHVTVVDAQGNPLPHGASGEIVVRSRYLASGYWRKPEETAAAFLPDPEDAESRVYRTGDLGRFLPDGRLVYEGRRDHQVKIRGYRVEIREVEAALLGLDGVREAAVVVQRVGGEVRLGAFVVCESGGRRDGVALRESLRTHLPEWKIPSMVEFLDVLPTTPTGKVDRPALTALALATAQEADDPGVSARTLRERELVVLWARALGRTAVSVHEDFFQAGGHSLQAMELVSAVGKLLARRVTLADLMAHPTVARFAAALDSVVPAASGSRRLLRGTAEGVPWFHVPGIYGVEFLTQPLAEAIGRHCPYFDGLEFPGLLGDAELLTDVGALAASMVSQIRAISPAGPLVVSGFSFGGHVARETARQLAAAGCAVEMLVLFDAVQRGAMRRRPVGEQLRVLARRARARPPGQRLASVFSLLRLKRKAWIPALLKRIGVVPRDRRDALEAAARAANSTYRVQPYSGRTELLLATLPQPDDTGRWERAPDNGWGPLMHRTFTIHRVACDHRQVFLEPVSPEAVAVIEQLAAGLRHAALRERSR